MLTRRPFDWREAVCSTRSVARALATLPGLEDHLKLMFQDLNCARERADGIAERRAEGREQKIVA